MQLELVGHTVAEVLTGYTLTIRYGADSAFELQIEGDLELTTPDGIEVTGVSEEYEEIGDQLRALVGATVTTATVGETSTLLIGFDTRAGIRVPADDEYEAWGLVGPHGYRVVCLPGGELALWSAREDSGDRAGPGSK